MNLLNETTYVGTGNSGAKFSVDRVHRFSLWRRWQLGMVDCPLSRMCCFIGLNPSTADETLDDPTIRRCIQFSKDWGFDGYVMLNLFSLRATDPKVMKAAPMPTLIVNQLWIWRVAKLAGMVVTAWGCDGLYQDRHAITLNGFRRFEQPTYHLGLNKDGTPKHPLYLKSDTNPIAWEW